MDPFRMEEPSVVAFSGGRTSGLMLHRILEAHGGELPPGVRVVFNNTGLEHPGTYAFVHEVETRWCPVTWLEYRPPAEGGFAVVDHETAHRGGEPFTSLIQTKRYLPNPVARMCTANLKIRATQKFCKSLGWEEWDNAIGLRADEPRRVAKMKGDIKAEHPVMPLAQAGITLADVLAFWKAQPFDLMLPWPDVGAGNYFGNCVGCFLKGRSKLEDLMREEPEHFRWWVDAEALTETSAESGSTFRNDRPTYAQMMKNARAQGRLFQPPRADDADPDLMPCMCTD